MLSTKAVAICSPTGSMRECRGYTILKKIYHCLGKCRDMNCSVLHAFRKTNGLFYEILWPSDCTPGVLVPEQQGENQGLNEVRHNNLPHSITLMRGFYVLSNTIAGLLFECPLRYLFNEKICNCIFSMKSDYL